MKFTVDRSKWFRGQGSIESRLLRADGMRCCIGFVAQQCGVPDEQLLDKKSVYHVTCVHGRVMAHDSNLENKFPKWMHSLSTGGSVDLSNAYIKNDAELLSDATREDALKQIFKIHGDEIEFVG